MRDGDVLMTVADVAEMLKVSVRTVHALRRRDGLPGCKIGGSLRFRREDVLAWIEDCREGEDAPAPLPERRPRSDASGRRRRAAAPTSASGGGRWDWIGRLGSS